MTCLRRSELQRSGGCPLVRAPFTACHRRQTSVPPRPQAMMVAPAGEGAGRWALSSGWPVAPETPLCPFLCSAGPLGQGFLSRDPCRRERGQSRRRDPAATAQRSRRGVGSTFFQHLPGTEAQSGRGCHRPLQLCESHMVRFSPSDPKKKKKKN